MRESHRQTIIRTERRIKTNWDLDDEQTEICKNALIKIAKGELKDGKGNLPTHRDIARAIGVIIAAQKAGIELIRIEEDIRERNPNYGADDGKNLSADEALFIVRMIALARQRYQTLGPDAASQILGIEDCQDSERGED